MTKYGEIWVFRAAADRAAEELFTERQKLVQDVPADQLEVARERFQHWFDQTSEGWQRVLDLDVPTNWIAPPKLRFPLDGTQLKLLSKPAEFNKQYPAKWLEIKDLFRHEYADCWNELVRIFRGLICRWGDFALKEIRQHEHRRAKRETSLPDDPLEPRDVVAQVDDLQTDAGDLSDMDLWWSVMMAFAYAKNFTASEKNRALELFDQTWPRMASQVNDFLTRYGFDEEESKLVMNWVKRLSKQKRQNGRPLAKGLIAESLGISQSRLANRIRELATYVKVLIQGDCVQMLHAIAERLTKKAPGIQPQDGALRALVDAARDLKKVCSTLGPDTTIELLAEQPCAALDQAAEQMDAAVGALELGDYPEWLGTTIGWFGRIRELDQIAAAVSTEFQRSLTDLASVSQSLSVMEAHLQHSQLSYTSRAAPTTDQ